MTHRDQGVVMTHQNQGGMMTHQDQEKGEAIIIILILMNHLNNGLFSLDFEWLKPFEIRTSTMSGI